MPRLQVLSSQVNPAQVYEILTSCSSSNDLSVFFPMTIDPIESESLTNNDVAFEAGVILYNYGLTYECMAATIANDATNAPSTQIRSRVHRLFQMAVAVLAKVGQDVWYGSLTGTASRLLLLQTVLTHTRIDVAIKLNLGDEYDVCCRDMQFLLQMVEFQQRLVPLNDRAIAAAA